MKQLQGLSRAFGIVIAQRRMECGISQEKLAERIDATNVYICLLENGQRQPSLNTAVLIARALDMAPDDLVRQVCSALE